MQQATINALLNNAALLVILSIIYELTYNLFPRSFTKQVVNGVLVALTCLAIMSVPFMLTPGIVFDTRSILISVTAFIFGPIATIITIVPAIVFRLLQGGIGAVPGVAVILTSAAIGTLWRRRLHSKAKKLRWYNVYIMGLVVHLTMMACMLLIPYPENMTVVREVTLPVMIIYPVATVLLCLLLTKQQTFWQLRDDLKQSEERFRLLFDKAPLAYQSLDVDGMIVDINKQWLDTFGYSRDEVIGRHFTDFLTSEYIEGYLKSFQLLMELGQVCTELEITHKSGRSIYISFDGNIGFDTNGKFSHAYCILRDITEQKKAEAEVRQNELKYRRLFATMAQGVVCQSADGSILSANPEAERILGLTLDQMTGMTSDDPGWMTIYEDGTEMPGSEHPSMVAMRTGKPCGPVVLGVFQPKLNSHVWISVNATPIIEADGTLSQVYTIFQDITAEKKAKQDFQLLFDSMVDGFALHEIICDPDGNPIDYRFLAVNPAFEQIIGKNASDMVGRTVLEVLPGTESYWIETYGKVALTGESVTFENYAASTGKHFRVMAYQPAPMQFACTFSDITDRKQAEAELINLNQRDFLTGVYNRRFFEAELERLDVEKSLPLSIIIGDINGVKFINDAFGHAAGDKYIVETAMILQSCCREGDVLARTGGDEFVILMTNTDNAAASEVMSNIKAAIEDFDAKSSNDIYQHSLSLGYATKVSTDEDIKKVMQLAEGYMYQRKLLEHNSAHSAIVSSIKATMFEKSHETEEHAQRLISLSKAVGMALNLSQAELDELELLASLHDIGKVGIRDDILTKPCELNEIEWAEIKRHPEIGYRIAMTSPELAPIAEGILCHHEWWDGGGYPQGLSGENIPLLSRIVAVADAYDAMTNDRPYRKALDHEVAIERIKQKAGSQFDPKIAGIFTEIA